MAYSEDQESSKPIRDNVRENRPDCVFISRKPIHHDCLIFNPSNGEVLAGAMGSTLSNHDIYEQITRPGFNWKSKKKGFGLSDSNLYITLIDRAEKNIQYYSNRDEHYLKWWKFELQELRGEI